MTSSNLCLALRKLGLALKFWGLALCLLVRSALTGLGSISCTFFVQQNSEIALSNVAFHPTKSSPKFFTSKRCEIIVHKWRHSSTSQSRNRPQMDSPAPYPPSLNFKW